jgi:hypothetical protein
MHQAARVTLSFARCECQLGEAEKAKERLRVVFDVDLRALEESDLASIW